MAGSGDSGILNRETTRKLAKVGGELNRRWGDGLSVLPYSHLQTLAPFAAFCETPSAFRRNSVKNLKSESNWFASSRLAEPPPAE